MILYFWNPLGNLACNGTNLNFYQEFVRSEISTEPSQLPHFRQDI